MGLNTTHGAWDGAYSAFSRWRNKLATVAGYAVWKLKGQGGFDHDAVMCDWGHMVDANYFGDWSANPEWKPRDPLLLVIQHSDCEGWLEPDDCASIAERLEELLPLLDGDGGGHVGNYIDKTRTFIDGCRLAAERGERLEFH